MWQRFSLACIRQPVALPTRESCASSEIELCDSPSAIPAIRGGCAAKPWAAPAKMARCPHHGTRCSTDFHSVLSEWQARKLRITALVSVCTPMEPHGSPSQLHEYGNDRPGCSLDDVNERLLEVMPTSTAGCIRLALFTSSPPTTARASSPLVLGARVLPRSTRDAAHINGSANAMVK
jgi:hypothetical protein